MFDNTGIQQQMEAMDLTNIDRLKDERIYTNQNGITEAIVG
jgi:hypothetical protein